METDFVRTFVVTTYKKTIWKIEKVDTPQNIIANIFLKYRKRFSECKLVIRVFFLDVDTKQSVRQVSELINGFLKLLDLSWLKLLHWAIPFLTLLDQSYQHVAVEVDQHLAIVLYVRKV